MQREFMEYHKARFADCSLLFYKNHKLQALLPANVSGNELQSHGGLSFGGLITKPLVHTIDVIRMFSMLKSFCFESNLYYITYKPVPFIYHGIYNNADLYALYLNKATLTRRAPSTVIDRDQVIHYSELRKRKISKAKSNALHIEHRSNYFSNYWKILESNLEERHNTKPVHSLGEIRSLWERYNISITLHAVWYDQKMCAGVVMFLNNDNVWRAQYIASNDIGKELNALDLLFDDLIHNEYRDTQYFDFGISTEHDPDGIAQLNEGLIFQKEGFGGRTVCYDTYQLAIH
jgi:hypothetical protein